MMKRILLIGISSLFVFCKDNQTTGGSLEETYTIEQGGIHVPKHSVWHPHIHTNVVAQEWHHFELTTTAVVRTIPTQYAEIAPPFSGRILQSFVTLGQKVSAGTPIFEMSAPEYFEAQKEYLNAQQEFRLAEIQFKREQDLLRNGVGVQQEVEQAESAYLVARTNYLNVKEALRMYMGNTAHIQLGAPLIVRAPIAGEVIESKVVLGQYLTEDAEPLLKIANLEKVWIVARVKEKDVAHLAKNEKVEIQHAVPDEISTEGTLLYINELVDEESRSVEVFVEVTNSNRYWKPGMFTTMRFIDKPVEVVTIPAKAVMQGEESEFVFVKVGEDRYEKRVLKTAGTVGTKVVVVSGLEPLEEVVCEGSIYLQQAL